MAEQAHAFANAERRHLTIVFCDLVRSTALSKFGPRGLRSGHCRVSRRLCAGNRALSRLCQYQGDGVLAYFGYPSARETTRFKLFAPGSP